MVIRASRLVVIKRDHYDPPLKDFPSVYKCIYLYLSEVTAYPSKLNNLKFIS